MFYYQTVSAFAHKEFYKRCQLQQKVKATGQPTTTTSLAERHKSFKPKPLAAIGSFAPTYQKRTNTLENLCKLRTKKQQYKEPKKNILQIYANISSGKKIFGLKLYELVDAYIEYREKHVQADTITAGRLETIKSQLKHFLDYKGFKTKLSELDRKSAFDYQYFRKQKNAQDVTIRNEQATINAVIKWAYENGLCALPKFEFDLIRISEASRRDTFTLDEYDQLTRYMRSWSSKKNNDDEQVRLEKLLIRDFILILSNTYMRVGEARQLKWHDIISTDYMKAEDSEYKTPLVYLKVRAETAKNRKSRDVITRGGKYFERLKARAQFTSHDDYVFTEIDSREMFSNKKLYKYWYQLMDALDIDFKERNISYYSLRHFGITMRLAAGVSIWDVAKVAGTGVAFIENHYGHASHEMMTNAALKQYKDASNIDFGMLIDV